MVWGSGTGERGRGGRGQERCDPCLYDGWEKNIESLTHSLFACLILELFIDRQRIHFDRRRRRAVAVVAVGAALVRAPRRHFHHDIALRFLEGVSLVERRVALAWGVAVDVNRVCLSLLAPAPEVPAADRPCHGRALELRILLVAHLRDLYALQENRRVLVPAILGAPNARKVPLLPRIHAIVEADGVAIVEEEALGDVLVEQELGCAVGHPRRPLQLGTDALGEEAHDLPIPTRHAPTNHLLRARHKFDADLVLGGDALN